MRFLLIFVTLCTVSFGLENKEKSGSENNGYAFYYPHAMGAKQPAKVCLAIDKHLLPAVVTLTFENRTCEGTTCEPHRVDKDFSCWEIKAPDQNKTDYSTTKIQIHIETSDKNVKFEEDNNLRIHTDNQQVMLETDRNTYKMGDTVKMRLIAFDFDLKPIPNYKISTLTVRSPYPTNAIVKEWENISTDLGLAHIEFQLAPDTPEGYWSIQADGLYAGFEVKKYILPRFQAIINGPDQIYNDSKSTSYTVCGKYSYGRNIKGVALLAAKIRHGYPEEPTNFSQVKDLKGGCAKFELFSEDLGLNNERTWSVDLTASVTEDGTEQVESISKYVYISRRSYSYRWNYKNSYMKPKLLYKGEFSLDNGKLPVATPTVEMCYKLTSDESKTCSNLTLDSNNHLDFIIPPLKNVSDHSKVEIEARVFDFPLGDIKPSQTINLWHSKSKNGIQIINPKKDAVNCQSSLSFTVLYNSGRFKDEEEVTFKYILTSRGDILNTGAIINKPKKEQLNLNKFENVIGKESYEAEANPVDQFDLELKLDKRIYTSAKLVIYYDYDNEVISDTMDIDVNACTPNHVEAEWSEKSLYPGEVGTLDIETEKDSLCSVSSIDKASTFLGSSNRIDTNNVVGRFNRYFYNYALNCIKPKKEVNKTEGATTVLPWIHYGYYSSLYDSFDAFRDSNIGVISNLQFISKECQEYPYSPIRPLAGVAYAMHSVALSGAPAPAAPSTTHIPASLEKTGTIEDSGASVDNRGSAVRSFFPETWLWDLIPVREGKVKVERKLPDSITNWEGSVVCMSENEGIGISDKIEIQGFKPFFVDVLLPYSIKRNKEILHLPIPVFNYLNHSLPIRVTLETSKDIVLVDGQDKNSFTMCLEAEDSYTHNYRIKATKLGNLDITVSADSNPAYAENCAPKSVIQRRDAVKKSLLVEPEGYPSSLIKSALLCANDSAGVDNINWEIVLPENIVPDTVDGKVSINSDILGPMFQNLESILVVPTGCGEQTMATLTPNLYVLQYLKSNNALTDKIKEKIFKNLEIGYQRMLTYAHDDGSFSAFGKSEKDGSMFLTAFVIRTFRQMKQYIFIDDDVINKAIKWIISHQLKNGCFDPVHHVFHEMGLASSKNQTTALTSYVLISLLETNIKIDDNVLSIAKQCIIDDVTNDKYTLAISSYALGLLNLNQEVKQRLEKLLQIAENKNGLLWWKQTDKSASANVEVSSYVLMSLLQQDPVANLGTASSIVRWLQSQMNPRGGFFSTTDTVAGLDAISRYAILVNKKEPNVKVSLATKTDNKDVEITKRDRTKTEILPLSVYPNEVKAKIVGDGCVAIQAAVNFYLDTPTGIDDLHLDIELKPINQKLKCSLIELKPCVSYTALGQINMAIVEVNMPSGYAADEASLHELRTNENDKGVKKFELRRNQVVFYLTQLGSDKVCLPFKIEENLIVENVANATVKFYDYYKPEVAISKSFKLEDCDANTPVSA